MGRWKAAGTAALGCGALWVVVFGWLAVGGQVREFWESAVVSLLRGEAGAGAGERLGNLLAYLRWLAPMALGPALAALPGAARPLPRPLGVLLGLWLAAAALGVASSGYFLNHQSVQLFAPLAALGGLGGAWLVSRGRAEGRATGALALGLVAMLLFLPQVNKYRVRVQQQLAGYRQAGSSEAERLGARLAATVPPGETVYALGHAMPVYFYCGRRAPTRYFHSLLFGASLREAALSDLQAHPPQAVVEAPGYYPVQEEFSRMVRDKLLGGYTRRADLEVGEFQVWWRNPQGGRDM